METSRGELRQEGCPVQVDRGSCMEVPVEGWPSGGR